MQYKLLWGFKQPFSNRQQYCLEYHLDSYFSNILKIYFTSIKYRIIIHTDAQLVLSFLAQLSV